MTDRVWNSAFNLLIEFEGGFVDNPNDKGGATKHGISKKQYPDLDIENLTLDKAKEIYRRDYWDRYKCRFLPDSLSIALFDSVVNSNAKRMTKFLQQALGVTADGVIGNQTIGAANRLPEKKVLNDFLDLRLEYLMSLKDWKHFGNGWGARVSKLRKYCEELI